MAEARGAPSQVRSVAQVLSFDLVSKFLAGLAGIFLIRFMPELQFARLTFALSLAAIATQVFASSFNRIFIVGFKGGGSTAASSLLSFELFLLLVTAIAGLPLGGFTDGLYPYTVAIVATACIADLIRTVYQKNLQFLQLSLFELVKSSLLAAALVTLGLTARGQLQAPLVLSVQAGVVLAVSLPLLATQFRWGELREPAAVLRVVRSVVRGAYGYLFGYFLLLAMFSQVDVVMLRLIASPRDLAVYGAAFRYYSVLLLALGAVHVVLLPLLQSAGTQRELAMVFRRHWRILGVFATVALGVGWIARWLLPLVDGGKYPEAVLVFQILVLSAIVSFAFSPHANLVMVRQDFRFLFALLVAGLVLSLGLNSVLIPRLGPSGAAIATLLSFGSVNGAIFARSRTHLAGFPQQLDRGKPLLHEEP